jgi:hypothetical protein
MPDLNERVEERHAVEAELKPRKTSEGHERRSGRSQI